MLLLKNVMYTIASVTIMEVVLFIAIKPDPNTMEGKREITRLFKVGVVTLIGLLFFLFALSFTNG